MTPDRGERAALDVRAKSAGRHHQIERERIRIVSCTHVRKPRIARTSNRTMRNAREHSVAILANAHGTVDSSLAWYLRHLFMTAALRRGFPPTQVLS
jgi:hypothetical protein